VTEPKKKSAKSKAPLRIPVVRDSTFCRIYADYTLLVRSDKDIELVCLQAGAGLIGLLPSENGTALDFEDGLTEIARIRMGWSSAVELAMNILAQGIESGRINKAILLDNLATSQAEDKADAV
jgi:hypothetical protein